ncbi:hypothetical protein DFH06DRAFT_558061 [Mycena polygramma]|nr:hypothetical protein DFH06DRAFT_558061 [Mycena polygramma]
MTRSASPNGAIEFSYDFPVAGPSRLPPAPAARRTHTHPRTRSPTRPRWENASYRAEPAQIADDADDEIDYAAFGYPRVGGRHTHAQPMPMQQTRNQWAVRAPSPSDLYPYASAYAPSAYPSQYTAYPSYPYTLALPHATGSSYDSTASALSACSRSLSSSLSRCSSQKDAKPAKIRKARRSVDSERAPSSSSFCFSSPSASPSSPPASLPSSPYLATYDSFDSAADDDQEDEEDTESPAPSPAPTTAKHTLRRQWAALSLRVRFGVFRAKRRMRNRVLSL